MTTNSTLIRRVSTGIAATAMAFGFAMAGAGAATAAPAAPGAVSAAASDSISTINRPDDRDRCEVRLSERRDRLEVRIRTNSNERRARVEADFDGRRGDRDRERTVRLRDGRGDTEFRIPRGARSVHVEVTIGDGRDRVRCEDDLDLGRRR